MSTRNRRLGRVKVPFELIEGIAASQLAQSTLAAAVGTSWTLTRHSALHRCKDGLYTACLVWHGSDRQTLTCTIRGLALEDA